ncbi:pro-sigmaK processing inhibitor BofA family protein [Staphylospora marina]|uniref:pro-sigmaK processing inhibitor BofA family protein n=1 Tax=Staphylospora marina TaxID=2490858 RepID=UPI000F5C0696|nr:pro-sigmaK processing inhibitor BofA family protein [Staphylospora marina]
MESLKWWAIAGAGGLLVLMAASRSVVRPLRWIWYGLISAAVGALVLFVVNLLGQAIHLHIPINPVTALIAGVLGIPGVCYLAAVQWIWFAG